MILPLAFHRLAEREGFEPSVQFPTHTLSKRAPSATRTSLQNTRPEVARTLYQNQNGGEGGIRTLEGVTPLTVFETARFNHSRTSPVPG